MKYKNLTGISVLMILLGTFGRMYAANYSYVDADGILRDSILLPIGTFLFLIGFLGLAVVGCMALASKVRED